MGTHTDEILRATAPAHVALAAARVAPPAPGRQTPLLLEHGTLEVRFYQPRGSDAQSPHDRDEVYVVASGSGTFVRAGERFPFVAGDLLFVAAGVPHRFEEFGDDFGVWVMFYGPAGGER
ncbi:MAG TPA: cupin domain-containing protein [Haliangiales bacterium]|nr:cupin domain-containing protein [Haliangiales bacterium]